MKSSVEPLEGNKVKVYVEVEPDEFDHDIDRAFKAIAREIKLPGFRNGKAPRKVLEARIGIGPAREQALRDAIPVYLARAVREHEVDLIATPEVELTAGQEEGAVEFDATCEVRPEIEVPGYAGLRVELPSLTVTDAEIDEAVDAERRRHGSLADLDRPVATGDYVTLDLAATRDGEEVTGLNTEDWSYEVGRGWIADGFDEQLVGASAGDELRFSLPPKGTEEPADFVVKVTKVQELVLPDLDDEWVGDHLGEFETVEEWRANLHDRIAEGKLGRARQELIGRVTEQLTALVDIEPPAALVDRDLNARVQNMVQQFQAQGIDLGAWLSATGQSTDDFVAGLRGQSEQAVKVDLALRAVATAEGLVTEESDLEAEYARVAMQVGQKARDVRRAYERNDAVADLSAEIRKSKALDWLLHHVEMVDPDGNVLDRDLVLGHDHDHDHDHDDHDHDHDDHDDETPENGAQ
ncbi:MAG: trigger factor [Ilumatobacteraceae bacterium]|nr:trigger factor [Ilumatobacteraceae bacterium]